MKIASVTFYPESYCVGGAQTSAIAFKQWCDIIGVECDVVGITFDVLDITSEHIEVKLSPSQMEYLERYDAVFFATPPPRSVEIDLTNFNTPYMFMLHGEGDINLYGKQVIRNMKGGKNFRGLVDINRFYKGDAQWYPCCRPEDCWTHEIVPREEYGLLYASRIFKMKNPILFMKVAKDTIHITQRAKMRGTCRKPHLKSTLSGMSRAIELSFDPFDTSIFFDDSFGLYWEVFGTPTKPVKIPRLNLSALEAINAGMMPITSHQNRLNLPFIRINTMVYEKIEVMKEIQRYVLNKEVLWDQMNNKLENSNYSFFRVKNQIVRIIEMMEKKDG